MADDRVPRGSPRNVVRNTWRQWLEEQMTLADMKHQSDLVKAAGVPQSAVSQWLLQDKPKKPKRPSVENARLVARAFKKPFLDVLVIAGYLTPEEAGTPSSGKIDIPGALYDIPLHTLLTHVQIRVAALNQELDSLRKGEQQPDDFVYGDRPRNEASDTPGSSGAAENRFL